jgi:uncharacterized protein YcfL
MKKLLVVIILAFVLVGCKPVEAEPETVSAPVAQVSVQEYEDLIERIGELEQEVANFKRDTECELYDICD